MTEIKQSSERKGVFFIAVAAICWSFGGICAKLIPWGAMTIIGLRSAFAVAVFVIYRRSIKVTFTRGNLLAAVCLSATTILFIFANKQTTAAAAILLQFTAPIFIILIEFIFYKKRPKPAAAVAVAITLGGMLLFFADRLEPGRILGNIIAIASGIAFAGVFICNKLPDTVPEQAILTGLLINMTIGLPFVFFEATTDLFVWGVVAFMGIVQVGLGYVFFSIGIKKTPALLAILVAALEPILSPVFVALAIGEVPGPYALAGGVIIVITVVSYNIWEGKNSA